jgi:hypothetical protein
MLLGLRENHANIVILRVVDIVVVVCCYGCGWDPNRIMPTLNVDAVVV